jgi:hypothetical protein
MGQGQGREQGRIQEGEGWQCRGPGQVGRHGAGRNGIDDVEEPETFFKFKSDFGPSLDKVEKYRDSYANVSAMRAKITPAVLTSNPKMAAQAATAMKDTPSVAKI